jgi:hypothetical protein
MAARFLFPKSASIKTMKKYRLVIAVTILLLLAAGVGASLYHDVRKDMPLRGARHPHAPQEWTHPLNPHDLEFLSDWMTFTYINKIFALPQAELQTSLGIASSGYPNITVRKAALERGEKPAALLARVKENITLYFATPHP